MAKVFGIDFAPLGIPFQRRLQTIGILYYASSFLIIGFTSFFTLIILIFTQYYYLSLLYLVWFIYDHRVSQQGGRKLGPKTWTRQWRLWKWMADYFPIELIKTADLDSNKNYIFGVHPHGIICAGAFCNFATEGTNFSEKFPGIWPHLLTLDAQFLFPLQRELLLSSGTCSASKESMKWLLTHEGKGHALVLIVGGAVEALDAVPGTMDVTLNCRKGFIKMAIKYGASLVPVVSFGENDIFQQKLRDDQDWIKKMQCGLTKVIGFSPPIFHGRGVFQYTLGFLPYRKPITTVVGKPIDVKQVNEPTKADVEAVHHQYVEGVENLFNEYKDKYGSKDLKLQIK